MEKTEIVEKINQAQKDFGKDGTTTWSLTGETRIPSSDEADEMESRGLPLDIDPEIRKLIVNFNKMGFKTSGSCAGHLGSPRYAGKGFISFEKYVALPKNVKITEDEESLKPLLREMDKYKIKKAMAEYGLVVTRDDDKNKTFYYVEFRPVGRPVIKMSGEMTIGSVRDETSHAKGQKPKRYTHTMHQISQPKP